MRRRDALAFHDTALHLRPEMPDQALYRPDTTISQRTDRVTFDLLGDIPEHIDFLNLGVSGDHAGHHPIDPAHAFTARRTLTATLMPVEMAQTGNRLDDIGRLVHHDDRRRAQPGFVFTQGVKIHQDVVTDILRQTGGGRATRDHGEEIVPATTNAACMLVDEFLQRDAHLFFDVARIVHMAGD